jgi:inosose dehydratase
MSHENLNTSPWSLATNVYPWYTFYKRQGRDFEADLEKLITEIKQSGADSLEPILNSAESTDRLSDVMTNQGVAMVSAYVNSELHEKGSSQSSIETVIRLATQAQARMGTKIIVTNPSPINWEGPENKNDDQIQLQGEALNQLGKALSAEGLTLAYHNHDPELRMAGREFHHMLASTDPEHVKFCLDSHWIYRGSGNSNVALYDVIRLYGDRIVELHIRQSQNGTWTETFGDGDIDYQKLTNILTEGRIRPLVTIEQAVEENSPNTMNSLEAHKVSHAQARKTFAPFLK